MHLLGNVAREGTGVADDPETFMRSNVHLSKLTASYAMLLQWRRGAFLTWAVAYADRACAGAQVGELAIAVRQERQGVLTEFRSLVAAD